MSYGPEPLDERARLPTSCSGELVGHEVRLARLPPKHSQKPDGRRPAPRQPPASAPPAPQPHNPLTPHISLCLCSSQGPVLAVRYNHSGQYCLSCGKDRTFRLWNPSKGLLIKSYSGHAHEASDASQR